MLLTVTAENGFDVTEENVFFLPGRDYFLVFEILGLILPDC